MIRGWMSEKVSRFCHRNDGPLEKNVEQKVKQMEIKAKPEKRMGFNGMTEKETNLVQNLIIERMKVFVHRDYIYDSVRKTEPCSICFRRYASIRCDPCTHGRVCKYCAYEMLKSAGYPAYQTVICTHCYKLIDAFTRWRKYRNEEGTNKENNIDEMISSDDENEDGIEHSVSLKDYGWQILNDERQKYRDNEAFEHSESTGSI